MPPSRRQSPTQQPGTTFLGLRPVVAGTFCCVISALGYTAASICMRKLDALDCDPMWATCNKEVVTVVVVGPLLLCLALAGRRSLPPPRSLALLLATGIATQFFGNLSGQWAYSVVGLAVTIPAIFGVMLTVSAVLGAVLLGERVPGRSTFGMGLLIVAILLLTFGSGAANRSVASATGDLSGPLWGFLGVAAAGMAGGMYAILTIVIRHTVTADTRPTAVVFIVTVTGVLTMGPLSLLRLGGEHLLATPPEQLAWMLAAGTSNLIAFLAITKGLTLTTVVHANLLNGSQVAMAAVAGMLLFAEPPTYWLLLGAGVTIAGILVAGRPQDDREEADQHA